MTLHEFVVLYTREHANTRKQLHAFPAEQSQFKPHERSSSAHRIGWTFVLDEMMMLKALNNEPVLGGGMPPAPPTWAGVLEAFDAGHVKVLAAAGGADEASLKPVVFMVAPKQTGDYSPSTFSCSCCATRFTTAASCRCTYEWPAARCRRSTGQRLTSRGSRRIVDCRLQIAD